MFKVRKELNEYNIKCDKKKEEVRIRAEKVHN